MRTFHLQRTSDPTGVSGSGRVAEGVQFSNGKCALSWCTDVSSIGVYQSIDDLIHVHGHEGQTVAAFEDGETQEDKRTAPYSGAPHA